MRCEMTTLEPCSNRMLLLQTLLTCLKKCAVSMFTPMAANTMENFSSAPSSACTASDNTQGQLQLQKQCKLLHCAWHVAEARRQILLKTCSGLLTQLGASTLCS